MHYRLIYCVLINASDSRGHVASHMKGDFSKFRIPKWKMHRARRLPEINLALEEALPENWKAFGFHVHHFAGPPIPFAPQINKLVSLSMCPKDKRRHHLFSNYDELDGQWFPATTCPLAWLQFSHTRGYLLSFPTKFPMPLRSTWRASNLMLDPSANVNQVI